MPFAPDDEMIVDGHPEQSARLGKTQRALDIAEAGAKRDIADAKRLYRNFERHYARYGLKP